MTVTLPNALTETSASGLPTTPPARITPCCRTVAELPMTCSTELPVVGCSSSVSSITVSSLSSSSIVAAITLGATAITPAKTDAFVTVMTDMSAPVPKTTPLGNCTFCTCGGKDCIATVAEVFTSSVPMVLLPIRLSLFALHTASCGRMTEVMVAVPAPNRRMRRSEKVAAEGGRSRDSFAYASTFGGRKTLEAASASMPAISEYVVPLYTNGALAFTSCLTASGVA